MTNEMPMPNPVPIDAATFARCDGPRRQLVFWSAVLLFIDLAGINLSVPSTLELEGYASLLQLVENPRVIPACLSLVVMYFVFRLIVEWLQFPPSHRPGRIHQADICVAIGLGCLSLCVLAASNAGVDVGSLPLVLVTTIATILVVFALLFAFFLSAVVPQFPKVWTYLALIPIGILTIASLFVLSQRVDIQETRARRVDAATLFAKLDALLDKESLSPEDVARGQRWRERIAAFSPGDGQLPGIANRFAEIAAHSRTASDVLLVLAIDEDQNVLIATAANQNTPVGTLDMLAENIEATIRSAVGANRAAPKAVLDRLANDRDSAVRTKVAANQATPESSLMHLAKDDVVDVQVAVARNLNTPANVLTKLLDKMANDDDPIARATTAAHPMTSITTLTQLAKDDVVDVRAKVAANPRTRESTLTVLAGDEEIDVQVAVGTNTALSNAPYAALVNEFKGKPNLRERLAKHEHTHKSLLVPLRHWTTKPDEAVR